MMPTDFLGRYCWLASSIGGSWLWQSAKERETTVETLSMCYISNAKHSRQMSAIDRETLEVMRELGNVICQTLSEAANRRIVCTINNVRGTLQDETELPF